MSTNDKTFIPIYKPQLEKYKKSAIDAIESEWISNHGKYIELATNKLKEILNVKYTILMSNGTVATHCLLLALKYKHPSINTIYVPNNVYVAAYNCAIMEYPIESLEVMKIDTENWNISMDEDYIKTLKSNSAILIVHNLGNIIDIEKLHRIRPDIILIEDNCEGIFGKYNGIYSGTSEHSLCSSVSFYGNKTITTGEGGAFITQHQDVYDYIKRVYSQGMSPIRYIHDVHAYNYRMTNIQAAFLYDQLNDIERILSRKKQIFENYTKLIEPLIRENKICLQNVDTSTERANWIFAVRIINNHISIEDTNSFFMKNNVEIRPFFYPYDKHYHLQTLKCHEDEIKSYQLNKEIILLPSFPEITYEQQNHVVNVLRSFIVCNHKSNSNFILINQQNIYILKSFLENPISDSFRYFKNRSLDVIQSHVSTLILEYENKYIGYGHIDCDSIKNWIGICILEEYQGKGFGKLILNRLIEIANVKSIKQLYLSVDKNNIKAFTLYEKMGFEIIQDGKDKYFMMKNL